MSRFLGIDFSGNHLMWRPGCRRSNVWISVVRKQSSGPVLVDQRTVQELAGNEHPFVRLVALLKSGEFEAAAIDAPFSIPSTFVVPDYQRFLDRIGLMENDVGRPFPSAHEFVKAVAGIEPPLDPPKPYRWTEVYWKKEALSVRSTLWAGARGGAAMTAACLKVLHCAQRPIWPWVQQGCGILVEAFPMAQLAQWNLPYEGYGKHTRQGQVTRWNIIKRIRSRIDLGRFEGRLASNADELDSMLCAFAAIAVKTSRVAVPPEQAAILEGWISVHQ